MSRATTCQGTLVGRAIKHTIAMQCACIKTKTNTGAIAADGVGHVGAINHEARKSSYNCPMHMMRLLLIIIIFSRNMIKYNFFFFKPIQN
jgi:hypothetical protein